MSYEVNPYVLLFDPIFVEKPWGGTYLTRFCGSGENPNTIGELWSLSAREERSSMISNGSLKGHSLSSVQDILEQWGIPNPFPILLKILDTQGPLSLQVHPTDEVAATIAQYERGKTEAWFILNSDRSEVVLGLAEGCDISDLLKQIYEQRDVFSCLRKFRVMEDDVVPVPAGTVHTTVGPLRFAEVQQSSNSTYRIYDWAEVGRTLHLYDAQEATIAHSRPNILREHPEVDAGPYVRRLLWACPYFVMENIVIKDKWTVPQCHKFEAIMALDGASTIACGDEILEFGPGRSALVPLGAECTIRAEARSESSVLRVYQTETELDSLMKTLGI